MKKEIWNVTELGSCQRSNQDKFRIELWQLDILNSTVSWLEDDCKEYNLGQELLNVIGDNLSIHDLKTIVDAFSAEYEIRETKRQENIKRYCDGSGKV